MKPETRDRIVSFFWPKVGDVVDFDLVSGNFMSWPFKVIVWAENRFELQNRPLVKIDRRVIIGYSKEFFEIDLPDPEKFREFVHTVGTKGIVKELINVTKGVDLFMIRRPVLGGILIGFILGCGGFMALVDLITEKLFKRRVFDM